MQIDRNKRSQYRLAFDGGYLYGDSAVSVLLILDELQQSGVCPKLEMRRTHSGVWKPIQRRTLELKATLAIKFECAKKRLSTVLQS